MCTWVDAALPVTLTLRGSPHKKHPRQTEWMCLPMYALGEDICMMMANSAAVRQQHTVSYMWANMVSTATKDARMPTGIQKHPRLTEWMCLPMYALREDICMMMADSVAVRQQHTVSYMWANMVSTATKDARMRQAAPSISSKPLPTGPVAKPIPQPLLVPPAAAKI